MDKIIILADDLTGACDTGIKLKNLEHDTLVIVDGANSNNLGTFEGKALSINTNTRSAEPDAAYNLTARTIRNLKKINEKISYYKKIDSVLRGNIGSEIDACLDILPFEFAMIAPALPNNGRSIRDGKLLIHNSEGPDALLDAAEAIQRTTRRKLAIINIDVIHRGIEALSQRVGSLVNQGYELILMDTVEDEDFKRITETVRLFSDKCLPVGSAGWIPHLFKAKTSKENKKRKGMLPVKDHVLVVVGTRHPVTVAQVMELRRCPDFSFCLLQTEGLNKENSKDYVRSCLNTEQLNCIKKQGVVITTDVIYRGDALQEFEKIHNNVSNEAIVSALAELVDELSERITIGAIIMSGGDVSGGVLKRLEVDYIDLLEELFPGIVMGVVNRNKRASFLVITKSGGFGKKQTLKDLYEYVCNTQD